MRSVEPDLLTFPSKAVMSKYNFLAIFTLGLFFLTDVHAQSCYDSFITSPSPFMGNNDEIFKLSDGSIWQVKYAYEYLYAYTPAVIICPDKNKLIINGKQLQVTLLSQEPAKRTSSNGRSTKQSDPRNSKRIERAAEQAPQSSDGESPNLIEAQIAGDFSGWDGETIFKLSNGQIWQQTSYAYTYHYAYRPKVIIFSIDGGYQMQVEGVDQRIRVARLR